MKAKIATARMDTPEEEILKADLMQGICEADAKPEKVPPVPVPKQIGGLTNLGKTFFWKLDELEEKRKYVEAQMVQKYGAEIYGTSASLKGQTGNGTASNTGHGDATTSGGGLIKCSVSRFVDLTHIKKESSNKNWDVFAGAGKALLEYVKEHVSPDKHKELNKLLQGFSKDEIPDGDSKKAWENLKKTLASGDWGTLYAKDKGYKEKLDALKKAWEAWSAKASKGDGETKSHLGGGSVSGSTWEPQMSMRIDIQTNFNESWYKRKFKSGFLNKMIFAIKTDARSHSAANAKTGMTDHKYTDDDMLAQDKRKLDSLQWKMTNKVAKDYISMLLGWSRKKVLKEEADGKVPVDGLKEDASFGAQMAKKALGNRGLLGRLRQKLFAGGQSNNVVSVAFQLADPNDGWTVDKSEKPEVGMPEEEPSEGGESGGEEKGGGKPTSESRRALLAGVCEGDEKCLDDLIQTCLLGE